MYAKPKLIWKPDIYMHSAIALLDGQDSTHDSRNSASLRNNILHLSGSTQGWRNSGELRTVSTGKQQKLYMISTPFVTWI